MAVGGLEDEWVSGWVGWRVGGWLACDQNDKMILLSFFILRYIKNLNALIVKRPPKLSSSVR